MRGWRSGVGRPWLQKLQQGGGCRRETAPHCGPQFHPLLQPTLLLPLTSCGTMRKSPSALQRQESPIEVVAV